LISDQFAIYYVNTTTMDRIKTILLTCALFLFVQGNVNAFQSPVTTQVENLFYSGNTKAKEGNYEMAVRDYSKAISLFPDFQEAYNNRGNAFAKLHDIDSAIKDYKKAIDLDPSDASAYNNLGNAYIEKDDLAKAAEYLTKAIEIKPDYAKAFSSRAIIYFVKGDFSKAWMDVHVAEGLGYFFDRRFIDDLRKESRRER
jgi:tetratricopeptide (TPR) repeat protein